MDNDNAAYIKKLEEPTLPSNRIKGSYFDLTRYTAALGEVFRQVKLPAAAQA